MFAKIFLLFALSCFSSKAVNLDDGFEDITGQEIIVEDVLETNTAYPIVNGSTITNLATLNSEFTIQNFNGWYKDFSVIETANLKTNTTYTIFVYKENMDNHASEYNVMELGIGNTLNSTSSHPAVTIEADSLYETYGFRADNTKQSEVFKAKITFKSFYNYKYLTMRPMRRRDSSPVSTEYCNTNTKIVLLEGDWMDYDIDYFYGTRGVEEIILNSNSVNLFNINGDINEKYDHMIGPYDNELIENNGIRLNNFSSVAHGRGLKLTLKKNTDYTLSFKSDDNVALSLCTPTAVNFISKYFNGDTSYTFNTGEAEEVILSLLTSGKMENSSAAEIFDVMLTEEIYPQDYSVYGYDFAKAVIKNGLNGIDGVSDYLIRKDNVWKIERNLKELILNKDTINDFTLSIDSNNILSLSKSDLNIKTNAKSISSLMYFDNTDAFDVDTRDSVYSLGYLDNSNLIKIKIANLTSVEDYINYISNKPIIILYEMETPEYESFGYNLNLTLFQGSNIVNIKSDIPTTMTLKVNRILNLAYDYVALTLEYPTMENIANARYWINLLDDSSLKDSLSDAITEITDIDDFKIEKKSISMNVDMYLKFKNSLGLSLETTSISFEDFSSTDAMVKNEAIKLNVSSTLDYNINTYLATDIVSSKNNKISKASLYIKNSSDTDSLYKSYASDKLTLLSSEAGINNTHLFDLKLDTYMTYKADVYKAVIKIEVQQF
jgi:hypothetical protein